MKKILKSSLLIVLVTVMFSQSVLASIITKHEAYISYNGGYPSIAWNKQEITSSLPQYFLIEGRYRIKEGGVIKYTTWRQRESTTSVTRWGLSQAHSGIKNGYMEFLNGYSKTFIGDRKGGWLPLSNTTRTFNY